jgi:hypothetical protein
VREIWHRPCRTDVEYQFNPIDLSGYKQNTEFLLLRLHVRALKSKFACCADKCSLLAFQFTFRRSTTTHVLSIFLPLIIITMVGFLGMLMGSSSGGRTGLGITVMLTTSSIYLFASDSVPKTGGVTVVGRMYLYCLFNGLLVITRRCCCLRRMAMLKSFRDSARSSLLANTTAGWRTTL